MHVVDAGAHLDEEVEGCVFTEILLFPNKIKKVALASVLEGQHNGILVLKAGVEPANILMIELLLNSDFPNQRLFYLAARQRSLLNLLHCHHDSCCLMLCELHFTI